MKKPILYSYFRSSCSYRVRIALYHKEIDFDYRTINLVKNGGEQNTVNYFLLNPMGVVPTFVLGDEVITQSMAILRYIDEIWPQKLLFPEQPYEAAKVMQIGEMINSGIQPIQNLGVTRELSTRFNANKSQLANWNKHWIERGFEALEEFFKKSSGDYCVGQTVTAADLFLVPQVYNAKRFEVDMKKFEIINKINNNCLKIEAFKKANPSCQPDSPET